MGRTHVQNDSDAPASAGALSCVAPLPAAQAPDCGIAGQPPRRRREDVLRQLELLALAELERLAADRQQPGDSPDLLASFIEWDLAVSG